MIKFKKYLSCILVISIIASMASISGCKKGEASVDVINEEAPWYNLTTIDIDSGYTSSEINNISYEYIGTRDGDYIIAVRGSKKMPKDIDWDTFNWRDYEIFDIDTFDVGGNLKNSIDLVNATTSDSENIDSYKMDGENIKIIFENYNENGNKTYTSATLDLTTGKIGTREKCVSGGFDASSIGNNQDWTGEYIIGKYTVSLIFDYTNYIETYKFVITDESGKTSEISLDKEFPNLNVTGIDNIVPSGEDSCYILGDSYGGYVFEMNLKKSSIKLLDKEDTEWFKGYKGENIRTVNGECLAVDSKGVTKIDFQNKTVDTIFSYDFCNFNRVYATKMELVGYSDNEFVFFSNYEDYYSFIQTSSTHCLYVFTKADVNPNLGKTVLEVSCLDGISEATANAVCEFNNTSKDYYLVYNTDYDVLDVDYGRTEDAEERNKILLNAQKDMSNALAIDLMSGDGPDIIIGGFRYGQLNNDEYLSDLSPYMNSMGTSGYFSNVFEGCKVNGKLYQVPISFTMSGIATASNNIRDGQIGFTFEEYNNFVDTTCNGKDPMGLGKLARVRACTAAMSDLFMVDERASFDCKAFHEMCSYVSDNVYEEYNFEIEEYYSELPEANYVNLLGFGLYLDNYGSLNMKSDRIAFLGIPSYDARGPEIIIDSSVGVSAQTASKDACWEFIKILLGDGAQESVAKAWSFPVKVSAYENISAEMVENFNAVVRGEQNHSVSGIVLSETELDEVIIQDFERDCILNGHVSITDPAILIIVSEEVQPYLFGQKDIGVVIGIIENRVAIVMDERK